MFYKKNFFNNFYIKSNNLNKNLKKTKKITKALIDEIDNCNIPVLEPHKKDFDFDFSNNLVKKFSKYKNIVIIGMGGSILGTKSIYSFLKKKIKKEVFFFDNLDLNLHSEFIKIKNLFHH